MKKYYQKIKLYGAGHPQISTDENGYFSVSGTKKKVENFFEEHETTHARFQQIDGRKCPKNCPNYQL